MKRSCIYIRVSTEEQSAKNQLPECLELAKSLGIEDPVIIEESISAYKNPDRKLMKRLEIYDHVIVWSYDRLQRNRRKFVEFMKYYAMRGTKIHSVKEKWVEDLHNMPSPWNEIIFDFAIQIIGWLAEEESEKKSDRVKLAVRKNNRGTTVSRKGNKWGRPSISTYKRKRVLELRNAEKPMSYSRIAKEVGISKGMVHKILNGEKDWFINRISN